MANLVGSDIGLNYKGILNLGATVNQNVSGSLQYLTDGDGNNLLIQVSTGAVRFGGATGLNWDDTNNRLGIGTATPLGVLHLKTTGGTTRLLLDGDAAQSKLITYRTNGLQRFGLYTNATAESGANEGSDFALRAYNDAGSLLTTPLFIKRSTGHVGINLTAPTASLQVRGDGTNLTGRFEASDGTAILTVPAVATNVSILQFRGFYIGFANSASQLIGIESGSFVFYNSANRFVVSNTGVVSLYNSLSTASTLQTLTLGTGVALSTINIPRFSFAPTGNVTTTSGTSQGLSYTDTFAAAAGSANYRPLNIAYTINNPGVQTGRTTGIFLNATVTALNSMTHNLMDLQIGGVSKVSVDSTGMVTATGGFMEGSGFTSKLYQNNLQLYSGNTITGFVGGGGFSMNSKLYVGATGVTPVARLTVRGDGTNAVLKVESSAAQEFFSVSNTGVVNFATTGGSILLTPGSSPVLSLSTFFASVGGLQIQMNTSSLSGAGTINKLVLTQSYSLSGASASNLNELIISPTFSATANPGIFNGLLLSFTIDQTSGANGITRGLYVAPTLTAAADFRAIEVKAGSTSSHNLILLTNAAGTKVFEVNAAQEIGFYGSTPVVKPNVAGARVNPEDALANLLIALANLGLITNSTT